MVIMESLSMILSSCPPILQNHLKTQKPAISKPIFSIPISNSQSSNSHQTQLTNKVTLPNHPLLLQSSPLFQNLTKTHLSVTTLINLFTSLPCSASEALVSSTDQASDKINLESILISIDDFFNRYPFFVAGCTFIYLVVIPITEEYLRKYKFISALDAYKKFRDDPNTQLLDIRDKKSLVYLRSPNLSIFKKGAVQVPFSEGDEDGFVKRVLESFGDASNTVVCILDNFDGNSIKVAELLFKNGFKEAYAIRGGVRGEKGWLAIQDSFLPPSLHVYPKKKVKTSKKLAANGGIIARAEDKNGAATFANIPIEEKRIDHGQVNKPMESMPDTKIDSRFSSPYPNYPDLKPPSSPTPSKPQS